MAIICSYHLPQLHLVAVWYSKANRCFHSALYDPHKLFLHFSIDLLPVYMYEIILQKLFHITIRSI